MTAAEILRAAAELVDRPGAWTQGEYARNALGQKTTMATGVCWCAIGAVRLAGINSGGIGEALIALGIATGQPYPGTMQTGIADWNDAPGRTAAEVAEAMRRAAASLDAGGGA